MNNRKKYGLIGLIIVVVLIILFVWGFASGVGTDHDSAPERADANATTGDSVQATSSPADKDKYLNQFLREQDDIMEDMMEEMEEDYNDPEGNASEDYLEGMIPHHQMAIDMSRAILDSTDNDEVRRLAENIITTQEDEIKHMQEIRKAAGVASS